MLRNDGFPTVDACADAAVKSGAPVVVICSTDATYPEIVPELARKIKTAKPDTTVLLAGAPAPEYKDAYLEAGVEDFIHVKANCYDILRRSEHEGGRMMNKNLILLHGSVTAARTVPQAKAA